MSALVLEAKSARTLFREQGLRAVFRRYGWKFFAAVFAYYLVRDVTLYVLLPMLIFKGIN